MQLSLLISGIISLFLVLTLSFSYWFDQQQRHNAAIDLSNTLMNALSQDLLKASLSNSADIYANLSFRIEKFKSVDRLIVKNRQGKALYAYARNHHNYQTLIQKATDKPQFEGEDLYVNYPLKAEGQMLGHVFFIIDTESLVSQLKNQAYWLIFAFPVEFILGIFLAAWISRRYSEPVEKLADSMMRYHPEEKSMTQLTTDYQNEFKALYDGFNKMVKQVHKSTEQLHYQADHDALTGLYNRFYIESCLKEALKQSNSMPYVLLYLDLDQFSIINDSAGFQAGDELLKMIASHCLAHLPNGAKMARIGGDDFYILLPNVSEKQGEQLAKERLNQLQDFRFSWEGEAYSVSASVGMVAFKPFELTLTELIKFVNTALQNAKALGKNKLQMYSAKNELIERFNAGLNTAKYIKEALLPERQEGLSRFELFAQAIVPLQVESEQFGYEILIRMWDAEGRFVPPDNFLPTAERYQMMVEIDKFVLWTYLETVTQCPEHIEKLHVAHVNLAGSSLNNPDFQASIKEAVLHFNFPWNKLELEVTETSAVGSFAQAREFIQWLKNVGIGLALDDFGTGMSSFEYLKSLPFDVVKIDGSFVKDMHKDPTDKAVIRYIQEIANYKGQETVAEYVETKEDVESLTEIGITYGQGYYLGKPKPLQDWLEPKAI